MKPYLLSKNKASSNFIRTNPSLLEDSFFAPVLDILSHGDEEKRRFFFAQLSHPLRSKEEIIYRQDVLKDVLLYPETFLSLQEICNSTRETIRNEWLQDINLERSDAENYSAALFQDSVYIRGFSELRSLLSPLSFNSLGVKNLQKMLNEDFSSDSCQRMLSFISGEQRSGASLLEARVDSRGYSGAYHRLIPTSKGRWRDWAFAPSFELNDRDDAGAEDLKRRLASSLGESSHLLVGSDISFREFFSCLSQEIIFYLGAYYLKEELDKLQCDVVFPTFLAKKSFSRHYRSLYDMGLVLNGNKKVVANDLDSSTIKTYLISGPNQGGKSTFIRSVMQAQILGQCGLFVGAQEASFPLRSGIFSHFGNDEENLQDSGRLVDEMARLNEIVDEASPYSLVFLNESFSSTNERDGSLIGEGVVSGLNKANVEVFYVSHFYELAKELIKRKEVLSLLAGREKDGKRNYKIREGIPQSTSYGEDIFNQLFKINHD